MIHFFIKPTTCPFCGKPYKRNIWGRCKYCKKPLDNIKF